MGGQGTVTLYSLEFDVLGVKNDQIFWSIP